MYDRNDQPLIEAACWAHARRKFFDVQQATNSPLALEALQKIGELYGIEEQIRGRSPDFRQSVRQARAGPVLETLHRWMHATLQQISKKTELSGAIRYSLSRWTALTRYRDDGSIEIDNNIAERALRTVALGRKNWLFAGSDAGGERAAAIYSLLGSAKLNGLDPEHYLRHSSHASPIIRSTALQSCCLEHRRRTERHGAANRRLTRRKKSMRARPDAYDRFALTANNITDGVVGEKIGCWKFFPARNGWGVIPVWGFADVIESKHADVNVGERLYGYFTMGIHLMMAPDKVSAERLFDSAAHRAGLSPVYNAYARTQGEPHYDPSMDDERMLLFPLYATSFCLHDFLEDKQWFGAQQIVILSASSKTAIGLAMALADSRAGDNSAPATIVLTSPGNLAMVRQLGLYSSVHAYGDLT